MRGVGLAQVMQIHVEGQPIDLFQFTAASASSSISRALLSTATSELDELTFVMLALPLPNSTALDGAAQGVRPAAYQTLTLALGQDSSPMLLAYDVTGFIYATPSRHLWRRRRLDEDGGDHQEHAELLAWLRWSRMRAECVGLLVGPLLRLPLGPV